MKKRAISFVLCLMMVVTLLGNGVPVYAADDPAQPVITTEETSSENTEGEASLSTPSEAEPGAEPEEEPEATPPLNATEDIPEESAAEATDETPETESEQPEADAPGEPEAEAAEATEEDPDAATPSEAAPATRAAAPALEADGIPIDEEHFPGQMFREWLLGKQKNSPDNPNVFGSENGILTEKERAAVKEIRFDYNRPAGDPPPYDTLDLTGIEYFPNLEELYVTSVDITDNLDLSQNTKLKTISLVLAGIKGTVDVSNLPDLENLNLNRNEITSLDVSHNTKLEYLGVDMLKEDGLTGQLAELDLRNNPELTGLSLDGNQLISLDLSNNKKLTNIYIEDNNLTSLDVSMLPELEYLHATNNELREIDVTKNPKLKHLDISGNAKISSLDITQNPELTDLYASKLNLFFLDAKNNQKLTSLYLNRNPLLGYEIVDGGTTFPIKHTKSLSIITVPGRDGGVPILRLSGSERSGIVCGICGQRESGLPV